MWCCTHSCKEVDHIELVLDTHHSWLIKRRQPWDLMKKRAECRAFSTVGDSGDCVAPQTWTVSVTRASVLDEPIESAHYIGPSTSTALGPVVDLHIDFRHLRLSSDTVQEALASQPEIKQKTIAPLPWSEYSVLLSRRRVSFVLDVAVDLSRNCFKEVDLNCLFRALSRRVEALIGNIDVELIDCVNVICMTSNDLECVPKLPMLKALKGLYFNHNRVKSIAANGSLPWATSSPLLEFVDMRNNELESINGLAYLLNDHPELQALSLSCNRLTYHSLADLPRCPKMTLLGLFANRLDAPDETPPVDALRDLLLLLAERFPRLQDLYLLGNPLVKRLSHTDEPDDGVTRVQFIRTEHDAHAADLLVSSWDSTVRLYNSNTGALKSTCRSSAPVLDATSLSPSETSAPATSKFACGGLGRNVELGDFERPEEPLAALGSHEQPIRAVCFHGATGLLFSGSWDKKVKCWDSSGVNNVPPKGSIIHPGPMLCRTRVECGQIELGGKVLTMTVSQAASKIIIGDSNKVVTIFDIRNLSQPESVREQLLKFQLRATSTFPDGLGFTLASIEGRVAWEYFASDAKKSYAFKCHREKVEGIENIYPVNAIAFHPEYGSFATGGGDGLVVIWDGNHKKRLWRLPTAFPLAVSSLSFNNTDRLAIGLSNLTETDERPFGRVALRTMKVEELTRNT